MTSSDGLLLIATARAVLFDMDGTLVDSHAAVEAVWGEVAERVGVPVGEILAVAHGVRAGDTMARYLPAEQIPDAVAGLEARELELLDGVVEVPGARALVADLLRRGVPVAIVTSASRRLATARLGAAGIPEVGVVITAEDVTDGKPAPDGYRLAATRLGVDIRDCVVVEDAAAGIEAGLAAGARVVVVRDAAAARDRVLPFTADYTAADPT